MFGHYILLHVTSIKSSFVLYISLRDHNENKVFFDMYHAMPATVVFIYICDDFVVIVGLITFSFSIIILLI